MTIVNSNGTLVLDAYALQGCQVQHLVKIKNTWLTKLTCLILFHFAWLLETLRQLLWFLDTLSPSWSQTSQILAIWQIINRKRQFRGTPSGSRPAFACWPALRSRQNHIFLVHFQTFFVNFSRETTEKALKWKKGWKTAEKNVSTSYWVRAAPKSWSKYTTNNITLKPGFVLKSEPFLHLVFSEDRYRLDTESVALKNLRLLDWQPCPSTPVMK